MTKKPTKTKHAKRTSKRKREVQYQGIPQYSYKQQATPSEQEVYPTSVPARGKSPMYMTPAELEEFNPRLPNRHRHGGYPFRNEDALAVAYFLLHRKTKMKKKQAQKSKSKKTKKPRAQKTLRYRMAPHLGVQCTDCANYGRLSTGKMGCKETLVPLTKNQAIRPKDCVFFVPTYIEI